MSVAPALQSASGALSSPARAHGSRSRVRSGSRRSLRVGVIGAVLALFAMGIAQTLVAKPFLPADESNHAAYALSVSRGHLPRIDAPVRSELPGQRKGSLNFVANHPPLYYVLVAPALRFAIESGHPRLGITLARLETVLLSAGAVVLTAWLAAALTRRRRPELAIGAAALLTTTGSYVLHAGLIHNDGLATTLVTGQLLATVLILARGLRRWPVLALIVLAALAMLTRVSNVSALLLSAAALVAAGALHSAGARLRGALRGLACAGALLLTCTLASGWFYLRNLREYGDPTGGDEVVRLLKLPARPGSIVYHAINPDTLNRLLTVMFGLNPSSPSVGTGLLCAVGAGIAAGLVVLGVRAVRALRSAAGRPAPPAEVRDRRAGTARSAPLVAIATLLVLYVAAVLLQIGSHIKDGGGAQPRYLFPVLPVLLIGAAAALLGLPGRLGRAALLAAIGVQAALSVAYLAREAFRSTGVADQPDALVRAVDLSGVPAPAVVLGALAVGYIAGLGMVAYAVWTAPASPLGSAGRHRPAEKPTVHRPVGMPRTSAERTTAS